ncbi:hypothetical protein [Parendozoicomonas haliclonae]|uniref:Uncharacterized protein n=1 Tax=Parendozoicomonas haliclonae TaxID=1960125 RepID=A0A1X7ALN1_9GAMM|nr:hypothetical protein [Parendozoicomonas haliclonae]SMA48340.1 hypothetical protein EHSB41UT_02702 [Parendozoicomonas haliclonae]
MIRSSRVGVLKALSTVGVLLSLSLCQQAASAEAQRVSAVQPEGFEKHLIPAGETLTSWHIQREFDHFSAMVSAVAGSYVLNAAMPRMFSPSMLLFGANLMVNYSTSNDWMDFIIRQTVAAVKVLPAADKDKGSGFDKDLQSFMQTMDILAELLIAMPSLVEVTEQLNPPIGKSKVHLGKKDSKFANIHFSNTSSSRFHLSPNKERLQKGLCQMEPDNALQKLMCHLQDHNIDEVQLYPGDVAGIKVLNICSYKHTTVNNSALQHQICNVLRVEPSDGDIGDADWITDHIAGRSLTEKSDEMYSPLTEGLFERLTEILPWKAENDQVFWQVFLDQPEDALNRQSLLPGIASEKLTVPAIKGKNMQLFGHGDNGFLLVDFTVNDSNIFTVKPMPVLWLNTRTDAEKVTPEELKNLEDHRIPGKGIGLWRTVNSLRSLLYRTLLNKSLSHFY